MPFNSLFRKHHTRANSAKSIPDLSFGVFMYWIMLSMSIWFTSRNSPLILLLAAVKDMLTLYFPTGRDFLLSHIHRGRNVSHFPFVRESDEHRPCLVFALTLFKYYRFECSHINSCLNLAKTFSPYFGRFSGKVNGLFLLRF